MSLSLLELKIFENRFNINYYLIKETQNDKKLSRKADCLAIKGRSHAIIKKANIQKVISNMEPFFIK